MKIILERVSQASVVVENQTVGQIDSGYLLLVGFTHSDTLDVVEKMAQKIAHLRVMSDDDGKMNKTLQETGGKVLAVPQFTLYADTSGRRPGFRDAAKPEIAGQLFTEFVSKLKESGLIVETGVFGAFMSVNSTNDGPLTLLLELERHL